MQRYTTIVLFSAIALSVGILGVYGLTSVPSTLKVQSDTQTIGAVPMLGHVTMTVTDPHGNIIAYHQGDNIVVNLGEDCLSYKVFGIPIKLQCTASGDTGNYNVIAIGNVTGNPTAAKTDAGLGAEFTTTNSGSAESTLFRATASTQTETDATSGAPVSDVLQYQFTNAGGAKTVTEAGLRS